MAQDEFDQRVEALRREAQREGRGFSRVEASERESYTPEWETRGLPKVGTPTEHAPSDIGADPSQKVTLPAFKSARVTEKPKPPERSWFGEGQMSVSGPGEPGYDDAARIVAQRLRDVHTGRTTAVRPLRPSVVDTNTSIYAPHLPEELQDDPDALREAAKDAARQNYSTTVEEQGEPLSENGIEIDGNAWTQYHFSDGSVFLVEDDGDGVVRAHDMPTGSFAPVEAFIDAHGFHPDD